MKQNIQIKCPKCSGKAILFNDGRTNKIRCFECGREAQLLNEKLKK